MRDADLPGVRLGEKLQLNVVELCKAERLGPLPCTSSVWLVCTAF
jgi:hypothetical protein